MGLNNRYLPSHPQGQACSYGLDWSAILPPGVGLASAVLSITTNSVPPQPTSDFTIGAVETVGRRAYAVLTGGISAKDYRLNWAGTDSLGFVWPRSVLLLCAATS